MATANDVRDAIVTELNATSFSQPFTAAAAYDPQFDLQEVGALQAAVVATDEVTRILNRGEDEQDWTVQIGLAKKWDGSVADGDANANLARDVRDHLKRFEAAGHVPVETQIRPLFDVASLRDRRTWISVIHLTYRGLSG